MPKYCLRHYFIYPQGEGLSYFYINDAVTFELRNVCPTAVTLPSVNPFVIRLAGQMPDESGEWWPTVYAPPAIAETVVLEPGMSRVWTWDTVGNEGPFKRRPSKVSDYLNGRLHDFAVSYAPEIRGQVDPAVFPDCWSDGAGQVVCSEPTLDYWKNPAHFFSLNVNPRKGSDAQVSFADATAWAHTPDSGAAPQRALAAGPLRVGSEALGLTVAGIKAKNETEGSLSGVYYFDIAAGVAGREMRIERREITLDLKKGSSTELPRLEYIGEIFPVWMDRMLSVAQEGYTQLSLLVTLTKKDGITLATSRLPLVSFPTFKTKGAVAGSSFNYQLEGNSGYGRAYTVHSTSPDPVIGHGLAFGTAATAIARGSFGADTNYWQADSAKATQDVQVPVSDEKVSGVDLRVEVAPTAQYHCRLTSEEAWRVGKGCNEGESGVPVGGTGEIRLKRGDITYQVSVVNGKGVLKNAPVGKYEYLGGSVILRRAASGGKDPATAASATFTRAVDAFALESKGGIFFDHSGVKDEAELPHDLYIGLLEQCDSYSITASVSKEKFAHTICFVDDAEHINLSKQKMLPIIFEQYGRLAALPESVRPKFAALETMVSYYGDWDTNAAGLYTRAGNIGKGIPAKPAASYSARSMERYNAPTVSTVLVHEIMHHLDDSYALSAPAYKEALAKQVPALGYKQEWSGAGRDAAAVKFNDALSGQKRDDGRRLWNIISWNGRYKDQGGVGYSAKVLNQVERKSGYGGIYGEAFAEEFSVVCGVPAEYKARLASAPLIWKGEYSEAPPSNFQKLLDYHKSRLSVTPQIKLLAESCLK